MFKNYFKTAFRSLRGNKLFTVLNIVGLAIGISVCLILFAFVLSEWSFDKMYKNSEDIYRVNMQTTADYNFEKWSELPNSVGPAMVQNIPEVRMSTRLIKDDFGSTASLKIGEKNFLENGLYLVDSSFFKMFDIQFLEGNATNAFSDPHSVVLSQSAKKRFFGNAKAVGKRIIVNSRDSLYVSGIYQDLPKNSVIDCDMIYNILDSWMGKNVYWSNASYETYIMLQPHANVSDVQLKATALIDKYVKKDNKFFNKFLLQPLSSVHLYSSDLRDGYSSRQGNITTVKSLLFLGLLVLLIACINYMNLSTAHSHKRAKGIGMNKVLGANKKQMIFLFYLETGLLTFLAITIGYGLSFLALPIFRSITGNPLDFSSLYTGQIIVSLIIIWLIVTIVAGSYPAISMANVSPLILVNKFKDRHGFANLIRKSLVIFQFGASIVLIIAVTIILQQMQFIKTKDLGYNPKGVIALSVKSAQTKLQVEHATAAIKDLVNVLNVSAVQSIPGDVESGRSVRKIATDKEGMPVKSCRTDGSILQTMQLKLLAGKNLPNYIAKGDTTCYTLINEQVAKYLGFKTPADAIGKYIDTELVNKSIVVGVMKNFNFHSLKDEIGGYVYYTMNNGPEGFRSLLVRYNTTDLPQLLDQLQRVFKMDLPNTAFDYQFLDRHVQNLYIAEQNTANTTIVFSVVAIFVACLGLFGLAAFTAEQRKKEIGIRKVLGASVYGVTSLLTTNFLKSVLIAFLIASPIAWWVMNKWLQSFAYRITIQWWVFPLAGMLAMLIAFATVSFQAIKAALANPVKSLRTE
ncbi:putative ABC transport system permease protein [Pedobacter sp. UYEF25]